MGYRSQVAFAIYGDESAIEELQDVYAAEYDKLDEDHKGFLNRLVEDSKNTTKTKVFENNRMMIYFDDIKWYDTYPIPTMFDNIWRAANQLGLNGEKIILGEDLNDVEEDYIGNNINYYIQLTRSISFNG